MTFSGASSGLSIPIALLDACPRGDGEPPEPRQFPWIRDELSPSDELPSAPAPPGLTPGPAAEPPPPCVTPSPPHSPPAGGIKATWAHTLLQHPPTQPGEIKACAGNQSM